MGTDKPEIKGLKTISEGGTAYWDAPIFLSKAARSHYIPEQIACPYEQNSIDLTLFLSCYNEEKFIVNTLNTLVDAMKQLNKTYEILVIDDCSKDRSLELVKDFIAKHPDVPIILRVNLKNKGLARNYIDGAFIGRGKYYRLICGDNSEPVETLVTVLSRTGEADIIVPYYEEFRDRVFYRQFLSKLYTKIINLISGNKIHYYNGLHVHLRFNIMRFHPSTRGFGFQAALLCTLLKLGFTYIEVPTITIERKGGRGDAITWKNLRSVIHIMLSVFMQRIAP